MSRRRAFHEVHARTDPRILLLAFMPIGDTLLAIPMMRALRQRYPAARLTAVAHARTAPLLRYVAPLDEVVELEAAADPAGVARLLATLGALRARRFEVAVDLTSPAYKWVSIACGVPLRTYMKFEPLWWLLPHDHPWWRSVHATRHYYDCARELDLPPWSEVDHAPRLVLPPAAMDAARTFLRRHGVASGRPVVVMHPGGAGLGGLKRWPPGRFAALADRLHDRWRAHIVVVGGKNDVRRAAAVAAAMRCRAIIAAGALPLPSSLAVIALCDLFIGNDSGPLHAAAAMGAPYVGIFGPTCAANFRPIGLHAGQGAIVQPAYACCTPEYFVGGAPVWARHCCAGTCLALATLSEEQVAAQANQLLQRRRVSAGTA
jgi:lipopolysaccharide heptosyltransferase II